MWTTIFVKRASSSLDRFETVRSASTTARSSISWLFEPGKPLGLNSSTHSAPSSSAVTKMKAYPPRRGFSRLEPSV